MIGLADIRDWLKTLSTGEHYYIGKIDNKQDKSVGVYQREPYGDADIAIGGLDTTRTLSKQVSVLLHWNDNAKETEDAAQGLYDQILRCKDVTINGHHVDYIRLSVPEPVDVGTDGKGIYERVIWLDFYYQRQKG